jgi:hypothetical protein
VTSRGRPLVAAAVLVALVAGAGLAAILAGGDEPGGPASTVTAIGTGQRDTAERTETTAGTRERTAGEPEPAASPSDERAIEQAVSDAVAATESGRPPPGIEPGSLPGSDELSFEAVRAEGDRGSATLTSGAVVLLRRSGRRWRVAGVRAP